MAAEEVTWGIFSGVLFSMLAVGVGAGADSSALDLSRPGYDGHGVCNTDYSRSCLFPFEDGFLDDGHVDPSLTPGLNSPTRCQNGERMERYSRKVFVGGLPPDIDEDEITNSFRRFGHLVVDWPHKAESKSYFPPKDVRSGDLNPLDLLSLHEHLNAVAMALSYAFLLFQEETSVQALIDACIEEDAKLYLCVSSPTIKDKPVQIRPWNLSDSDFVMDGSQPLDPRKTIFVGGVPRPLRAGMNTSSHLSHTHAGGIKTARPHWVLNHEEEGEEDGEGEEEEEEKEGEEVWHMELAMIMDRLYGGVCYAGIDTDPELKYPKGAGRVAFSNQQSYIAAISARFVQLQHNDIDKRAARRSGAIIREREREREGLVVSQESEERRGEGGEGRGGEGRRGEERRGEERRGEERRGVEERRGEERRGEGRRGEEG
ncbi:Cytoplasmic polyadenylation element-binding protein 3 [Takifugu flavidus]|uniref:Cytoplasmic polyadenylation element-binding protein 3 n=1 Tax=Takifugu flavidus TaxID=433684 RepID=A0A5C6PE23_9TELE|nr:Cytoplasmic polyadenylation element-binding protein 3 [Takifugu flavidus]